MTTQRRTNDLLFQISGGGSMKQQNDESFWPRLLELVVQTCSQPKIYSSKNLLRSTNSLINHTLQNSAMDINGTIIRVADLLLSVIGDKVLQGNIANLIANETSSLNRNDSIKFLKNIQIIINNYGCLGSLNGHIIDSYDVSTFMVHQNNISLKEMNDYLLDDDLLRYINQQNNNNINLITYYSPPRLSIFSSFLNPHLRKQESQTKDKGNKDINYYFVRNDHDDYDDNHGNYSIDVNYESFY